MGAQAKGRSQLGVALRLTSIIAAIAIFVLPAASTAFAQELPQWAQGESPLQRRAFILAIPHYDNLAQVGRAANDGSVLKAALRQRQFEMIRPEQGFSRQAILDQFDIFLNTIRPGDPVIFYFSGHGFERRGVNYIAPADIGDLPFNRIGVNAISLNYFMDELEDRRAGLVILILDACRTQAVLPPPSGADRLQRGVKQLSEAKIEGTGLAPFYGASRTTIIYASSPGSPSFGGFEADSADSASVFTREFVAALEEQDVTLADLWPDITERIVINTSKQQRPWMNVSGGYAQQLVFNQSEAYRQQRASAWSAAALSPEAGQAVLLKAFIKRYPDSPQVAAAQARMQVLLQASAAGNAGRILR